MIKLIIFFILQRLESISNFLQRTIVVYTRMGVSVWGSRTCGDFMFSGHTILITMTAYFIRQCKFIFVFLLAVQFELHFSEIVVMYCCLLLFILIITGTSSLLIWRWKPAWIICICLTCIFILLTTTVDKYSSITQPTSMSTPVHVHPLARTLYLGARQLSF